MPQQGRDARLRTQPGHGHTCAEQRREVGPGSPECGWSSAWAEAAAPEGFQAPSVPGEWLLPGSQLLSVLLPKRPGHQNELVSHFCSPSQCLEVLGRAVGAARAPKASLPRWPLPAPA